MAAYDGLSDEMKRRIKSLRYRSSFSFIVSRYVRFGDPKAMQERASHYPEVEQPVVRIHPDTGQSVLYVNDSQTIDIIGLDKDESAALLRDLTDEFKRPEYQVRWKWSDGDIAVWDNRAVQHYGVPNQTGERIMSRISRLRVASRSVPELASLAWRDFWQKPVRQARDGRRPVRRRRCPLNPIRRNRQTDSAVSISEYRSAPLSQSRRHAVTL